MSLYNIPFYNALLRKPLYQDKGKTKHAVYSHVLVYGAIVIHSQGDLGCIASNETIAKEVGMSAATVANAISDLKKAGWLKVEMRSASMRSKIFPMLGICVLNGPSASLESETSSLQDEGASLYSETRFIVAGNTFHSTVNIDNNINNNLEDSLDNSKDINNWQAIVFYFYGKIAPSTPPKERFRRTTKEAALHLLSLHSEEVIKRKIDALAADFKQKQFVTRFELFCNKFDSLQNKFTPTATTFMSSKVSQSNPNELPPDF